MEQVNERSTAYLTVTFKDKAGAAQQPTAASYRIDDVATGTEIRADTPLTPGTSVEITLTTADNAILSPRLEVEKHVVTVTGTYGENDAVRAQYVYEVVNLQAVT